MKKAIKIAKAQLETMTLVDLLKYGKHQHIPSKMAVDQSSKYGFKVLGLDACKIEQPVFF
jgi:leucyl aminopeptidase